MDLIRDAVELDAQRDKSERLCAHCGESVEGQWGILYSNNDGVYLHEDWCAKEYFWRVLGVEEVDVRWR